ncbi:MULTISPECIES: thiol:disulfide interchange protein DsbA/DsbL [Pseudomonadota]|mgnify:CR=1 FL=1|jgi:thiol:disulfide interchange protein DsbA|uniref:Thiol:disulfide interchange protein n=2 Tax=Pseudomonadota TaxID=1224 RepID=A0A7Y1F8Q5_PSEVE|nr:MULTISPECIES: thiol:disulfide interchange protein DsbA/DsbL [Pseudomonadota]MCH1907209.1 thiol:disulfide interchange protein DsbA/DsbL [Stenotrophomonas sp. Y6]MCW0203722.1 thiol:disulfide interchange protein DsbA/DsbL [Rhodanobacter thiooxydans]NMY08829.1 thiol:disulfide interchange protein DsbA/DsbL [Pseudomonas veronii]RCW67849.1 thiol:disulfide interchange protein DsbA [Pseudorhodoferax soli]
MKRRHFLIAAAMVPLAPLANSVFAQEAFKAGKDFLELDKPVPVDAPPGKVEVIEFFSYNCPHCAAFEPQLEIWTRQLPSIASFRRVPVPFVGSDVEAKQRMYYALQALGKEDEFRPRIFRAIHQEHQRLFGDDAILAWADKQPGLDGKKFAEAYHSFSTMTRAKRATQTTSDFKVAGVPALGIAGRWYADGETAGSPERALQVTSFLIREASRA